MAPPFIYTSPDDLLYALTNVAGLEDSHSIPRHENLGHDHSTYESWTTEKALNAMASVAKSYKSLNPSFEMVVGRCYIPNHDFHSYSISGGMDHHLTGKEPTGILKEATSTFKDLAKVDKVIVFEDRLLIYALDNNLKEKRLSP